jgi:para-nitrobenzyl esterase
MVATPLAHGLFQRAIGESGGQFSITRTLKESEDAGVKFAEGAGASSLSALRAMPADAVNRASQFQTSMTVDGWVFPQDVMTIFKTGKQNDVPVIIGSNANEGSIFTQESTTGQSFRAQSQRRYGADTDAFMKLYPFTTDQEARAAQAASMRDQTFGWEMRTWARLQTQTGKSKVYLYYLSHVPPLPNAAWLGAQHGAENPYAFNWPNGKHSTQVPWTGADKKLADEVSSYWVNFATTGDPNGKSLPKWSAYQAKDDQAMGFGDVPVMIPVPNKAALDFLDGYAERTRASQATRSQTGR